MTHASRGSADVILIPEIPLAFECVCEKLRDRYARGSEFAIVVVSEAAKELGHEAVYRQDKTTFKEHALLGGIAERLARRIETATGFESFRLCSGICSAAARR